MKLEKILDHLNSFEKNSFLKIIDGIITNKPRNATAIDKVLSDKSRDLKNVDNLNIVNVFNLVADEYSSFIKEEFLDVNSQLDIVIDIVSRDGKCIMKQEWFGKLYEKEILNIQQKIKTLSGPIAPCSQNRPPKNIPATGARPFLVTLGASVAIAWLTAGYRALRAAMANPVTSLRTK